MSRTFSKGDWAWVKPLQICLSTKLSVKFLTNHTDGLIFYSGPLSSPTQNSKKSEVKSTPLLTLQLKDGYPQLILEGTTEPILLTTQKNHNSTFSDGNWHTVDILLDEKVGRYQN